MFCFVSSVTVPLFATHTHKEETAHYSFSEAKLLFFSVLLAFSQRNNHFCGCKGTHK